MEGVQRECCVRGIRLCLCLLGLNLSIRAEAVSAQIDIVPDKTLPIHSALTPAEESGIFYLDGGTVNGTNLLHSFESFSIPQGSTVIFRPETNITGILSRVTGEQLSAIDGRLQVIGDANFFLINPHGIVFGADALLDIGGSLVATTAERLQLEQGVAFSATELDAPILLSIARPNGLWFGKTPGTITNRSRSLGKSGNIEGLQVQPGRTLALIGGAVNIEGGKIVSPQSSIELAGVGSNSFVKLIFSESHIIPDYEKTVNFGDVTLSQLSLIDSSGFSGGRIDLRGRNISISDGSQIISHTYGNSVGGDIFIEASENFEVVGAAQQEDIFDDELKATGILVAQKSTISANLFNNGKGGNIFVQAKNISVRDGGNLNTSLFGAGSGGDLNLNASQLIEVVGKADLLGISDELTGIAEKLGIPPNFLGEISTASSLAVANLSTGQSGSLNITSNNLSIRDGGLLSANPVSTGPGGDITISVTEALNLLGTAGNEIYASAITIEPLLLDPFKAQGQPGNLQIQTSQLRVLDGARIGLDTGRASGGRAVINADDSVEISGRSPSGFLRSTISARSTVEGSGGRIDIETDQLNLSNYGIILAGGSNTLESEGPSIIDLNNRPKGGNIAILANSASLEQFSEISTAATSDLGGNIDLKIRDTLLLRRNSEISAQAGVAGDGGNVTIEANFLVTVPSENNDITASAFAGRGGEIDITAKGILGFKTGRQATLNSDISAGSEVGIDGTVIIDSPDIELDSAPIGLNETFAPPSLSASCFAVQASGGTFVRTGRGGLPISPSNSVAANAIWQDLEPGPDFSETEQLALTSASPSPQDLLMATEPELEEASAWTFTKDGEVQLISLAGILAKLSADSSCSSAR